VICCCAFSRQVINLSIATYVSSQAEDYQDTLQFACQIFQEASDAGKKKQTRRFYLCVVIFPCVGVLVDVPDQVATDAGAKL
jgi:hypothetical protein